MSPSPYLRAKTGPVSDTLCFLAVFRIPDDGLSPEGQRFWEWMCISRSRTLADSGNLLLNGKEATVFSRRNDWATGRTNQQTRFDSVEIFSCVTCGPTQPPVENGTRDCFPWLKRYRRETHLHLSASLWIVEFYFHSRIRLHGVMFTSFSSVHFL
jgi:hypothetical protein